MAQASTATGRKPVTLADLERRGEMDGFRSLTGEEDEARRDDAIEADSMRCACCGNRGGVFRGYLNAKRRFVYRAFAICNACGHANEF